MVRPFFSESAIIDASFAVSLAAVILVRKALLKRALLDHPNERSSHTIPVPRGGGWALLIIILIGLIMTSVVYRDIGTHAGLILGVILLAIISWIDDRKGVKPITRLSLHILAACLGSLSFTSEQTLFAGALPFWLDRSLMIIGWAWFINLYNFMDGIDGITSVETISLATGSSLVMAAAAINDPFLSILTLLLTGVCLGFLALNWHPAKIFLGDVGSVPLGFLASFALIFLAVHGALIPALILPLYYLADSGITLIKRALRGEKIWQAHRQHFYQRAAQCLGRHDKVVGPIIAANLALIGTSLLAVGAPEAGFSLAVLVVAILLYWMHKTSLTNDRSS